ncbi:MAG: hypothetical protein HWE26_21300 [Alteromonadaceae bacterium]|nr:hypothetical protein [Alteromonadaceae bacterium]
MKDKHLVFDALFTLLASHAGACGVFKPNLIAHDIVRITIVIDSTVLPVKYLQKIRSLSKK